MGMGMGMIRWEWEGNGNKKVIPAHLYDIAVASLRLVSPGAVTDGDTFLPQKVITFI